MKFLVLASCLAAVALARPDVSHLNLNSYGAPSVLVQSPYSGNPVVPNRPLNPSGLYSPLPVPHQRTVTFLGVADEQPAEQHLHITYVPAQLAQSTHVAVVKAPLVQAPLPRIIVPTPTEADKTVIYVLQKRPEQPAPIQVQLPETHAAHPEVVFVKYNNEHDAQQEIQAIASGGRSNGEHVHTSDLRHEGNLITLISKQGKGNIQVHTDNAPSGTGLDGNAVHYADNSNGY